MSAKPTGRPSTVRVASLDDLPPAPPLDAAVRSADDAEIARRAASDPDATIPPPEFWETATIVEPEGTTQITLRLPKRVVTHFKSTGKGYQSRISAVLASYVDAERRKAR